MISERAKGYESTILVERAMYGESAKQRERPRNHAWQVGLG